MLIINKNIIKREKNEYFFYFYKKLNLSNINFLIKKNYYEIHTLSIILNF